MPFFCLLKMPPEPEGDRLFSRRLGSVAIFPEWIFKKIRPGDRKNDTL